MPNAMDCQTKTDLPLMEHQANNLELSRLYPSWLFADDTGTGKTLTGISIILDKNARTLIVCPKNNIESPWIDEIEKWAPDLSPFTVNLYTFWKRGPKHRDALKKELMACKVAVTNYDSFKSQIDLIKAVGFPMLILDESHKVSNPATDTTKKITKHSAGSKFIYEFTGTPAPNSRLEYFSQFRILDPNIFGWSITAFKARYFNQDPVRRYKFYFKKFNPETGENLEKEFNDKLKSRSSHVSKFDVLDLPERTFNMRYVELSKEEAKAYIDMKNNLAAEFEQQKREYYEQGFIKGLPEDELGRKYQSIAANQAVKTMKLRQITSGFAYVGNDGQEVPLPYRQKGITIGTSKLDELKELLAEIGDHQVIITYQFHYEVEQIERLFWDEKKGKFGGKTYGIIDGTKNDTERYEARRNFESGHNQYLLGHTQSISTGLNLQMCQYMIHLSIDYSALNQGQAQDRIFRKGQKGNCSYYYLMARINSKPTIDEVIYRSLQGKKDALQEVLNYVKRG